MGRPVRDFTQAELKQVIHYDQKTGVFTWRVRRAQSALAGEVAGSLHKVIGCVYIGLWGKKYKAHRLAWFYVHGHWPKALIDHRDLNPANNALRNLREATKSQNGTNCRVRTRNRSGLKGVTMQNPKKYKQALYKASVKVNGRATVLGYFPTAEEAHAVYVKAAKKLHGEFARAT